MVFFGVKSKLENLDELFDHLRNNFLEIEISVRDYLVCDREDPDYFNTGKSHYLTKTAEYHVSFQTSYKRITDLIDGNYNI